MSQHVGKLIQSQSWTDRCWRWQNWIYFLVPITDCNIFQNIALVNDISSPTGNQNSVWIVFNWNGLKSSLFQVMNNLFGCQFGANHNFSFFMANDELFFLDLRSQEFVFSLNDLNWLNFERSLTVLWEWPNQSVQTSHCFWSAQCCNFDEDVLSVDWNLGVVRVDDWRDWQDSIFTV